jgi:hypothetical protein
MSPIIHDTMRGLCALTISLAGAVPAMAQSGPASSSGSSPVPDPSSAARAWSGYRPGTGWTRGAPDRVSAVQAPAPSTTPSRGGAAPVYASRTGWATYAPSASWTGYRASAGWRGYEPGAARPTNRIQARVPGPSPYADGVARSYREYGTGRAVPLAKPWLPGSP